MLEIVGGVYEEAIVHPHRHSVFGSGGRAAYSLARAGSEVRLHTYTCDRTDDYLQIHAAQAGYELDRIRVQQTPRFEYLHGLATPLFSQSERTGPTINVVDRAVLRYGMLEGDARVTAERAVYDPQSPDAPEAFHANGSTAEKLALVLNRSEARALLSLAENSDVNAALIAEATRSDVVVLKRGPFGAEVWDGNAVSHVPAYWTRSVNKVGSGDVFSAYFAQLWAADGVSPTTAAQRASLATAAYCEVGEPPTARSLASYAPAPIVPSPRCISGYRPRVYLAGPFFCLAQLWLIEETRRQLIAAGLEVFSPYHDVGRGAAEGVVGRDLEGIEACDVLLAVGDGLDTGTVFEVGYARAIGKPVVFYCENEKEEDLKMMAGSDCTITADFVTAVYQTVWSAISS